MKELLPKAREIVAKGFRENSVVYRGVMGGQFDNGKLVKDALMELVNAGGQYLRLPEELPPDVPQNIIDDE